MPYIPQGRERDLSNIFIEKFMLNKNVTTPGVINYFISRFLWCVLKQIGESYTNFNMLIGVLECAKLELYRRKVSVYETQKLHENGDVYE